jgi:hypothetical protein
MVLWAEKMFTSLPTNKPMQEMSRNAYENERKSLFSQKIPLHICRE